MNQARELLSEKRIRHLPVVNQDDQIIAILSQRDLTDVARFEDLPVDLFASCPVYYVTHETPLSGVVLLLIEKKISSLILCDSDKNAIGIITTDDLLYEFSQLLKEKEGQTSPHAVKADPLITAGELFRKLSDIGI